MEQATFRELIIRNVDAKNAEDAIGRSERNFWMRALSKIPTSTRLSRVR